MNAVYVLIVLAVLGACAYIIWGKTRATVSVTTSQNKDQLRDALTNFLTHRKYIAASQSENLLTFAMDKSASCIIGFLLLCLGLIPGILYLALGGSTKTLTIQFSPQQTGWNVRIQGQRAIVTRCRKVVALGSPQALGAGATPIQSAQMAGQMVTPVAAPAQIESSIGQAIPALGSMQGPAAQPVETTARTCSECGAKVKPDMSFCSECGAAMA